MTESDITKTGPMNASQLLELNALSNDDFNQYLSKGMKLPSLKEITRNAGFSDKETPVGNIVAETEHGGSRFDPESLTDLSYLGDVENTRALNQPGYVKLANGIAKAGVLAGTTFLDGTLGLATGLGTMATEGKWRTSALWDNPFSEAMKDINDWSEKNIPNYYTDYEKEAPFHKNIFTANFIGDKFIKNLGFTVGAFYSGGVYTTPFKGARMAKLLATAARSSKAPAVVSSIVGSTLSAVNEGRIEALNNSTDWADLQETKLNDDYRQSIQSIKDMYGDSDLTNTLIAQEDANYEESLAEIGTNQAKMGNANMMFNLPILMASNITQFGKLFGGGFNTARRVNNIRKSAANTFTTTAGKTTSVARALLNPLSEGVEEISQSMVSTAAGEYYEDTLDNYFKKKIDPEAEQEAISWIKTFGQAINETVNDNSAWEEFFIGTLTGALGMPSFGRSNTQSDQTWLGKDKPVGLSGGVIGELMNQKQDNAREQSMVDHINNTLQSPESKTKLLKLTANLAIGNEKEKHLENDDAFEYKNAEHKEFVNNISIFDNAGLLTEYTGMIEDSLVTSDENLDAIIDNTTDVVKDASGKEIKIGPFIDKNGNPMHSTPEGKKEMIEKVSEYKTELLNKVEEYRKAKEEVDMATGQRLSDDLLEELTWLKTQAVDWDKRGERISGTIRTALEKIKGGLNKEIAELQMGLTDAGAKGLSQEELDAGGSPGDISKAYTEREQGLKSAQHVYDQIEAVLTQSDKVLGTYMTSEKSRQFLDQELSNALKQGYISLGEVVDVQKGVDDLHRIYNGIQKYNLRLNAYYNNPNMLADEIEQAELEVVNTEAKKVVDNMGEVNTISQLKESLAGILNPKLRAGVIEQLNTSENTKLKELTVEYNKINESQQILSTILDNSEIAPHHRQSINNVLIDAFEGANSLKEAEDTIAKFVLSKLDTKDESAESDIKRRRKESLHVVTQKDITEGNDVGIRKNEDGSFEGEVWNTDNVLVESYKGTLEEVQNAINARYDAEINELKAQTTSQQTEAVAEVLELMGNLMDAYTVSKKIQDTNSKDNKKAKRGTAKKNKNTQPGTQKKGTAKKEAPSFFEMTTDDANTPDAGLEKSGEDVETETETETAAKNAKKVTDTKVAELEDEKKKAIEEAKSRLSSTVNGNTSTPSVQHTGRFLSGKTGGVFRKENKGDIEGNPSSHYEIVNVSEDGNSAEFIMDTTHQEGALGNFSAVFDEVSDYEGDPAKATKIIPTKTGKIVKEGNTWKVVEKAGAILLGPGENLLDLTSETPNASDIDAVEKEIKKITELYDNRIDKVLNPPVQSGDNEVNSNIEINAGPIEQDAPSRGSLRSWKESQYDFNDLKDRNKRRITKRRNSTVNKLEELGVYSFVDSGKLGRVVQKYPDTKIHYILSEDMNDTELLAIEITDDIRKVIGRADNEVSINGKQYLIVGALGFNAKNRDSKNNIQGIKRALRDESQGHTGPYFVSEKFHNKVSHMYSGRMVKSTESSEVSQKNVDREFLGGEGLNLGFYYRGDDFRTPTIDRQSEIVEPLNTNNNNPKEGSVWLMSKEADGKWYAKAVQVKRFTNEEFPLLENMNTPIVLELLDNLTIFADPKSSLTDRLLARDIIEGWLHFPQEGDSKHSLLFKEIKDDADIVVDVMVSINEIGLNIGKLKDPSAKALEILTALQDETLGLRFQISPSLMLNETEVDMILDSGILTTDLHQLRNVNASFDLYLNDLKTGEPLTDGKKEASLGHTGQRGVNSSLQKETIYVKGKRYSLDTDNKITDSLDKPVTDSDTIDEILLFGAIARGEGTSYKDSALYIGTYKDGSEFGIKGKKVFRGDSMIKEMLKIDKQVEAKKKKELAKKVAEEIERDEATGDYSDDAFTDAPEVDGLVSEDTTGDTLKNEYDDLEEILRGAPEVDGLIPTKNTPKSKSDKVLSNINKETKKEQPEMKKKGTPKSKAKGTMPFIGNSFNDTVLVNREKGKSNTFVGYLKENEGAAFDLFDKLGISTPYEIDEAVEKLNSPTKLPKIASLKTKQQMKDFVDTVLNCR